MGNVLVAGPPRRFVVAAALAVAAVLAFIVCLQLQLPNSTASIAIDDIGEALAALVAAGAATYAARSTEGRIRLGWALLAISALSWGLGEVMWSVYEVGLQVPVPYPGWSDVGFLAAIPFAFAGVRAFWRDPHGTSTTWRVWLDAAVIAAALLYVAWVLGLSVVWQDTEDPISEHVLDLAYPIGDILVGTVLVLAVRRATRRRAFRMLVLLGGIAANGLSDSAFSYLTATGNYTIHGSVLDAGWFLGYLMIAFAGAWPRAAVTEASEEAPVDLWQLALPWLAVLAAGMGDMLIAVRGQTLDMFLTVLTGVGAGFLTVMMILTNRDFLRMLVKSRASEATLAEVVAQAPAGVVRIGTDLRVLDANPRFLALIEGSVSDTTGALVTRFFAGQSALRLGSALDQLQAREKDAVEGDGEITRASGGKAWVHWSATAVQAAGGGTDYFIAMFEDTTARHEAEAAAAASLELMQRLNAVKTEFLQGVSHEFKTALIGIQGFSEFMRDADQLDVNDARAFAADIYRDAARLDRMVTEMVALDRVETGRGGLDVQEVDMQGVVATEVANLRDQVHGNTFVVHIDAQVPSVAGDRAKLSEVVHTLLDNAIKRSPDGGQILVTARAVGGGVEVSVKDEGVGGHDEYDNRLFGADDVYANNPIRKVVGTGLAMGIARQIVEMHGGRLWLNGGGSEFHFNVPVLWRDRQAALQLTGASGRVA
jgi:PAS domain S-box-containing protein